MVGSGLFVAEMALNRRLTTEAQERLRIFVETSPAAIVTIDEQGSIELANRAAAEMMAPQNGNLVGHPIAAFLPELHHALRRDEGPQFRASMQCRGHRDNGESFVADIWFSTYKERLNPKLAAIIGEVSDDGGGDNSSSASSISLERIPLNARELGVLRFLVQGLTNKEIAARAEISESAVREHFSTTVRETRSANSKSARSRSIGPLSRSVVSGHQHAHLPGNKGSCVGDPPQRA